MRWTSRKDIYSLSGATLVYVLVRGAQAETLIRRAHFIWIQPNPCSARFSQVLSTTAPPARTHTRIRRNAVKARRTRNSKETGQTVPGMSAFLECPYSEPQSLEGGVVDVDEARGFERGCRRIVDTHTVNQNEHHFPRGLHVSRPSPASNANFLATRHRSGNRNYTTLHPSSLTTYKGREERLVF